MPLGKNIQRLFGAVALLALALSPTQRGFALAGVNVTIAHLLEIETVNICIARGIVPPVWSSANTPGGDEKNAAYLKKYRPRVKCL